MLLVLQVLVTKHWENLNLDLMMEVHIRLRVHDIT